MNYHNRCSSAIAFFAMNVSILSGPSELPLQPSRIDARRHACGVTPVRIAGVDLGPNPAAVAGCAAAARACGVAQPIVARVMPCSSCGHAANGGNVPMTDPLPAARSHFFSPDANPSGDPRPAHGSPIDRFDSAGQQGRGRLVMRAWIGNRARGLRWTARRCRG
jgi:hypothetical protein